MTSTPVSLNDESLNGSWIDINSASQIHSPIAADNDCSDEFGPTPYCSTFMTTDPVQNIGLMSFQVERFLQEAHKASNNASNTNVPNNNNNNSSTAMIDNISDICLSSESDASLEVQTSRQEMLEKFKLLRQCVNGESNTNGYINSDNAKQNNNNNLSSTESLLIAGGYCYMNDIADSQKLKMNGDQLSDSLSLLSRASAHAETTNAEYQDSDWLWDWTAQPEYFSGQEWKVSARKKDYMMKQRQLCEEQNNSIISREMLSLLFLTNILSIIIGAGITYSMLMRRSNI